MLPTLPMETHDPTGVADPLVHLGASDLVHPRPFASSKPHVIAPMSMPLLNSTTLASIAHPEPTAPTLPGNSPVQVSPGKA